MPNVQIYILNLDKIYKHKILQTIVKPGMYLILIWELHPDNLEQFPSGLFTNWKMDIIKLRAFGIILKFC